MTRQTTNLNLNKPDMSDQISDTITQLGTNFDIIDSSLAQKAQQIDVDTLFKKGIVLDSTKYPKLTGETDDTGRFQRAINDSVSKGYLPVFVVESLIISNTVSTPQAFKQPLILGQGYKQTAISYPNMPTGLPAISFTGGSGQLATGGVMMIGFDGNTDSIGVEFSGCCGVNAQFCRFGANKVGVLFHNKASGSFTEYCRAIKCQFDSTCGRSIEYRITSGNDSFHGSGLEDCMINQSGTETEPKILINSGCNPYNAPLSFQCWATTTTPLIKNLSTKRPTFHGKITIEANSSSNICTLTDTSNQSIYTLGEVSSNSQYMVLGNTVLCSRIQKDVDGSINLQKKDYNLSFPITTGANNTVGLDGQVGAMVQVYLRGSNYDYAYLLAVYCNQSDNNGSATTLATLRNFNSAGYGAPTFSFSGGKLVITNANFPASGVTAYISVKEFGSRYPYFML